MAVPCHSDGWRSDFIDVQEMTVYELIQELAYYPADADVSVIIGKDTKLDIDSVRTEFNSPALKMKSVVLEAS